MLKVEICDCVLTYQALAGRHPILPLDSGLTARYPKGFTCFRKAFFGVSLVCYESWTCFNVAVWSNFGMSGEVCLFKSKQVALYVLPLISSYGPGEHVVCGSVVFFFQICPFLFVFSHCIGSFSAKFGQQSDVHEAVCLFHAGEAWCWTWPAQ